VCARQGLCVLLAAVLLAGGAVVAADPEGEETLEETLTVRIDHGRLTLRAEGVALDTVLRAIAQHAGITIVLETPLPDDVSAAFDDVALDEGLRRLLGSRNHVLVYEAGAPNEPALLRHVKVEAPGTASPSRAGVVPGLDDSDSTARVMALEALADSDAVSFDVLLDVAQRDPAPALRIRALELLSETEAQQSRVEDAAQMASRNDPDREVREAAAALLEGFPR
jgi:hypothetical protein